jgi:predicted CXXCH cytochrome family protein
VKRSSAILFLLLLIGAAVAVYLTQPSAPVAPSALQKVPPAAIDLSPPAYSPTTYLNTGPDARPIGSAACAGCHANNHKSYALTAHSRALVDVNPADEPPDGAFDHELSGRSYRVYRKDGQLWHEEVLRTADGKEVARVNLPVRYRLGSGHFTRTYLAEVDGFLHESPITWFVSKGKWDMSPGYDAPQHWGFERPARLSCLACHAGNVEATGESVHRMTFHEKAIGCENCHGPGSKHQELHLARKLAPGEADLTIVHPGKLPRTLLESVCAACHLSTPATVDVRGRRVATSRPGLPLSDFRVHYNFDRGREAMTVVGHVEQLRQSRCYQQSQDLTCVTCHDPHASAKPADTVAFYRQKCLDCHGTKPCSSPPADRLKRNPDDNCAACHMPRGDTDIQHVAFTHHRIGRHAPQPPRPAEGVPDLMPLDDNPHLSPIDRKRNAGLAYMEVFRNLSFTNYANAFRERARSNLRVAYAAGLRDAETVFALAEIAILEQDLLAAAGYARETLAAADLQPDARAKSLQILATCERESGRLPAATELLEQNVRLRRFADDWRLLGANYLDDNKPDKALPLFQQALAIRPYRPATHLGLAECYRRLGDNVRARDHFDKARWLQLNRQN